MHSFTSSSSYKTMNTRIFNILKHRTSLLISTSHKFFSFTNIFHMIRNTTPTSIPDSIIYNPSMHNITDFTTKSLESSHKTSSIFNANVLNLKYEYNISNTVNNTNTNKTTNIIDIEKIIEENTANINKEFSNTKSIQEYVIYITKEIMEKINNAKTIEFSEVLKYFQDISAYISICNNTEDSITSTSNSKEYKYNLLNVSLSKKILENMKIVNLKYEELIQIFPYVFIMNKYYTLNESVFHRSLNRS